MASIIESVRELSLQKPFDKSTIGKLEEYVISVKKSVDVYDFDVLKCLLKLYGVYPEESKSDLIATILCLGLMKLPSTDFLCFACLIPVKSQKNEPLKTIYQCADNLERCTFAEFWENRNSESMKNFADSLDGFDAAIRKHIVSSLQGTYRNISVEQFNKALGLSTSESTEFVKKCDSIDNVSKDIVTFKIEASDSAIGHANVKQQSRSLRYDETLKFLDLVKNE